MSVSAPDIPMTTMAQDAYAYLEPVAGEDPNNGWVLLILCGAIGEAFREVEEVARAQSGRQPYQQAYDIDESPGWLLGWLGQFVGVPWTDYTDDDAKRAQVRDEAGFYRGSPSNMLAAVTATQTEAGRAILVERTPDAWGITVAYDPLYTPDVTAFQQAAERAVAWALALTITSTSVPLFEEGTLTFEAVASSVTFESATLTDVT